jgi:hypothetical protein
MGEREIARERVKKETWRFEVVCCTSNKPDIIELARILSFDH